MTRKSRIAEKGMETGRWAEEMRRPNAELWKSTIEGYAKVAEQFKNLILVPVELLGRLARVSISWHVLRYNVPCSSAPVSSNSRLHLRDKI